MYSNALAADDRIDVPQAQSRMRVYASRALTRLRMQAALEALGLALTVSAWALVLLIVADKLFSLRLLGVNIWVVWGILSVMGLPYILWRSFAPYIHAKRAAVVTDDRLSLHARISSALTLDLADEANANFSEAFLREATHKMATVRVQDAFPVKPPRTFWWLLVPAGLAAGAYFLPQQDVLGIKAQADAKRRAEERREVAAKQMERGLEDLKKALPEKQGDEKSGNYKVNQLIKDAEKIAKDLKQGESKAEDSLKGLMALKKQIEDEKEKIQRGKEFSDRLEKLQAKDLNLEETTSPRAFPRR